MIKTEVVETTLGKVQGYIEESIKIFKGIPYAASPIRDLRFSPPIPREPWNDIFMAKDFGPIAPQPLYFFTYDAQLREIRATMILGKEFKIVNAPFDKERAVWDGIHLS
ncbi:MAG: carboxylesterase family protein [Candidatus Thorarchaeota archaeon]